MDLVSPNADSDSDWETDDDADLRARTPGTAEESDKLKRETEEARSKYFEKLILYRCLQSIAAGDIDPESSLSEYTRMTVAEFLSDSDWSALRAMKSNPVPFKSKSAVDADENTDFADAVAKCVASKLESMVSMLVSLSGETGKKDLESRLDQMKITRDEVAVLERAFCKAPHKVHTVIATAIEDLNDAKVKNSDFLKKVPDGDEITIGSLVEQTNASVLKADRMQCEMLLDLYPKERVEKLDAKRKEQQELTESLEKQIAEAEQQLQEYANAAGPEFDDLVREYAETMDQVEHYKWALKAVDKKDDAPE